MNINPSGKNFAACIIHPDLTQSRRKTVIGGGAVFAGVNNLAVRDCEAQLEEAIGLAGAIGLTVVYAAVVTLPRVRPATLFGSGKVKEISKSVSETVAKVATRRDTSVSNKYGKD